jgi:hypothetical protein
VRILINQVNNGKEDIKMRIRFMILSIVIVLTACASSPLRGVRDDFDRSIKEYNNLLVSGKFEQAGNFVTESHREDFNMRAKTARSVHITGYHILSIDDEIELKGAATVNVQFDYTVPPDNDVRTLVDHQDWSYVYVKNEGRKRWRLMTLLPEFK